MYLILLSMPLLLFGSSMQMDCTKDFSEAVLWNASSPGQLVMIPCSELHPSFHHGINISRQCRYNGTWSPVDLRNCTMNNGSQPIVIVYFTIDTNDSSNLTTIIENNINETFELDSLEYNVTVADVIIIYRNYSESSFAISISFSLYNDTVLDYVVDTFENEDLQKNFIDNINNSSTGINVRDHGSVLAFQPSLNCSCDAGNTTSPLQKRNVCTCSGPCSSVPPCSYDSTHQKCNSPTFVGNGSVCGLNSDSDSHPDVKLDCDGSNCEANLTTNCSMEQDKTWNITWPTTLTGATAMQKCPGGSKVEGNATRVCVGNNDWASPNVSQCRTIKLIKLRARARNLLNNSINTTRRQKIRGLVSITAGLRTSINATTTPILPNDISITVDTLETTINVTSSLRKGTASINMQPDIAENCAEILNTLLNEKQDDSFKAITESPQSMSVSERLLRIIEEVGILFAPTSNSNQDETINATFNGSHIVINAVLPSHKDAMENENDTYSFQKGMPNKMRRQNNLPVRKIRIPKRAVRKRFNKTGKRIPIVIIFIANLESRLQNDKGQRTVSAIISIQISDTDNATVDLDGEKIELITDIGMLNKTSEINPRCAFWDFTRNGKTGGFSVEGIKKNITNNTLHCYSDHLTSFAVLVDVTGVNSKSGSTSGSISTPALSVVSYIGCGISIACLALSVFLFLIFRKNIFNQVRHFIHMNLSVAILVGLIVFVSGIEAASDSRAGCLAVAILLHYFFLAAFSWMLCEAIVLLVMVKFVFYKGFFSSRKFFLLLGWGLPVPFVVISAAISHEQYGINGRCWISEENGAIWAFLGPMLLIILINSIVYVIIVCQVFKSKYDAITVDKADMLQSVKMSLKVAIILLPLLGITWVFGLLAVNEDTIAFAWIFTILNSLQGLFIFLLYIVKNKKFLTMLKQHVTKSGTNSSIKANTQSTSQDKAAVITNEQLRT